MKPVLEMLAMMLKFAVLFVVLFRFHASLIGLCVVLGMTILLFRLDRALLRWATKATGQRR